MIWATVSSWSCFCWLYRFSPSLAVKNIISLISVLTIWWCPSVESSLVLLEEGVCYDQCVLLAELYSASFCTPRPNLPVTSGVSWLPTFAFQSPIMKKTSFLVVGSRRSCRKSGSTVRTGHGTTDWFQIGKGVHQGCILSPCLFNIYAEYIMRNAGLGEAQAGIKIAGRNINNFRYADDTTLWQKVKKN